MKLWLDDVRPAPDLSWTWARSVAEAQQLLTDAKGIGEPWEMVSVDYDLGMTCQEVHAGWQPFACSHTDGMHLLMWFKLQDEWPDTVLIHSENPNGRALMEAMLRTNGFEA